jgi:TetR/AcrR family acrAB operon transcriptional repressor
MRRTKQDAYKTKAEIIDAASALFEDVGFEGTTMEAIAEKANVTRGAVYWHFSNKAAVLEEIIIQEHAGLEALITDALSQNVSPFRKLEKLLLNVIDHFYENHRFRQYIKITWYKLSSDLFESLLKGKSAFVQNFLKTMEDLLEQSKQSEEIDPALDVQQSAFHLSCLINGFYRLYFVAPAHARNKQQTIRLFQTVLSSFEI